MNIIVVGMGKFGSALASLYLGQGHTVFPVPDRNSEFHQGGGQLRYSTVLLCVPTQDIPEVVSRRGALLSGCGAIVSTAKGILREAEQTPLHYIRHTLKNPPPLFVLSGPSFAGELNQGQPTALVLAGKDENKLDILSRQLSSSTLRLYKSHDPHGVELCGALKNVYAIASGMVEGLGFGDNTRAALTTRALSEMARIGHALGGKTLTFFGLAGVGDLFLTCSSRQSRNYQFGMGRAQGRSKKDLLASLGTVEGVWTADVAHALCKHRRLRAPLLSTVVAILNDRLSPQEALKQLMSRKIRHEFD